ncbi:Lrp/AsnC family transcriptional regulator [Moritella viscosa]|uniref:Heme biosynthesis protein n=1 Tax=Moritella viscosa TaxID=80854 RepID=A0A1L0CGB3_9GAMM|nr:Lrp/AsnC family transcriptional regulator [Moritella viscosa]SGZ01693.1 Putative heme biosynthesis protein [Moritella viscosa]SGZ08662.1 Putative heme biosynthesis protein [Moritella viscosa]SGZ10466.1 Putative heme biosynthesis protein [Moritella viscosa]SGZ15397.1 Putative heme biosynthesis protein [Moritella viscosa]SGZ16385.1 Putative heme biosynthesis protein [Moritella viscosa]
MTNLKLNLRSELCPLTNEQSNELRVILEKGLPISNQPYLSIANQLNHISGTFVSEQQVIQQIKAWENNGLIKRFGIVVKHRQLGYKANAMIVWDISNEEVDSIANKLALRSEISLCYRRPRQQPEWPYNLFCMIHGQTTNQVEMQIASIISELKLGHIDKSVLFSHKAYKQHGARYQRQVNP